MPPTSKSAPSFFIVPDEKIDYKTTVKLGNVIYRVTEPDVVLFSPESATPPLALGSNPSEKELKDYSISSDTSKSSKYGLFAKVLDFFGFGANISHTGAKADSEAYEVKSIKFSGFSPQPAFLSDLANQADIKGYLTNSADSSAYLITGIAVASGIVFKSTNTKENENEGSFGVNASGVALGPSGKRSKKMTLVVSYTDEGPTVLAFRAQKLLLKDGKISAEPYADGAYFGDDDEGTSYEVDFDAELGEDDVDGMGYEIAKDELVGEDFHLYLPDE